ncbi:hypothetical protein cyc_02993 [Cyclospora cayetanensis]|uniref:Uncharacterized protein n=1 Tax=Cyclospora cayetanensis TaxID=88456 RepID=A0A1D3CXH2_9EIME|nr:hypothetical protein cyc_02993 [Cyclospora cayetanensis]
MAGPDKEPPLSAARAAVRGLAACGRHAKLVLKVGGPLGAVAGEVAKDLHFLRSLFGHLRGARALSVSVGCPYTAKRLGPSFAAFVQRNKSTLESLEIWEAEFAEATLAALYDSEWPPNEDHAGGIREGLGDSFLAAAAALDASVGPPAVWGTGGCNSGRLAASMQMLLATALLLRQRSICTARRGASSETEGRRPEALLCCRESHSRGDLLSQYPRNRQPIGPCRKSRGSGGGGLCGCSRKRAQLTRALREWAHRVTGSGPPPPDSSASGYSKSAVQDLLSFLLRSGSNLVELQTCYTVGALNDALLQAVISAGNALRVESDAAQEAPRILSRILELAVTIPCALGSEGQLLVVALPRLRVARTSDFLLLSVLLLPRLQELRLPETWGSVANKPISGFSLLWTYLSTYGGGLKALEVKGTAPPLAAFLGAGTTAEPQPFRSGCLEAEATKALQRLLNGSGSRSCVSHEREAL